MLPCINISHKIVSTASAREDHSPSVNMGRENGDSQSTVSADTGRTTKARHPQQQQHADTYYLDSDATDHIVHAKQRIQGHTKDSVNMQKTNDDNVRHHKKDGADTAVVGVQQRHAARRMHLVKSMQDTGQQSNNMNADIGSNDVEDLARIHQRRENRNLQSKQDRVADDIVEPVSDVPSAGRPTVQRIHGIDAGSQNSSFSADANNNDVEESDAPEFEAEVVENVLLAEVVDETEQRKTASRKFKRSIGMVVLFLVIVLLLVVGGLCGNGLCSSRSTRSAISVAESCNLLVSGQVNVQTVEFERLNALSRGTFIQCNPVNPNLDAPLVDPEGLCAFSMETCDVLPYQVSFLFTGGSCEDNVDFNVDPDKFSCQDGTRAFPPPGEDFGFTAYLRFTDILQPDVIYFADYVSVFDRFTLTNRGAPIGPDIRMEIYDSEDSATNGNETGLMQTVFYYDICSYPEELLSRFGAVQSLEYFFGSQTLRLGSGARTIEIEVSVDGPNTILQSREEQDEDDATISISIDEVVLIPSFAATISIVTNEDDADEHANTLTAERDPDNRYGVVVGSASFEVPWIQNTTERFTLQAEVTGTGPSGEACSGIGLVDFRAEYV